MIVCTMLVEVGAISLATKTRPVAGSVNTEIVTGTSRTVTVISSKTITVGTDYTVLGSAFEV